MRHAVLSLTLIVALATPAPAQTLDATEIVLADPFNLYAPSVLHPPAVTTPRMWIGGWGTTADIPLDRIYRSDFKDGAWTAPEPSFQKPGSGVNDPSVVPAPGGASGGPFSAAG